MLRRCSKLQPKWLADHAVAVVDGLLGRPPDKIGLYLDWRTQEVGIAAARSEDPALIEAYHSGDVYHALAVLCGLTTETDPIRWKREQRPMRDRMKPLQLGINYGMGVPSRSTMIS